jgi:arabinofuranosyltransferase
VSDGAHLERGDWPWLLSLLVVGCLTLGIFALTAHRFTGGQRGVPLDDAWIHFQFARNLARGDGLSFNPGQPTSGSTAPLWTLLLAAVYLLGGEFPVAGQVLSAVCFLAALATTYALGRWLTGGRWTAWLAGAVVAVNGRMIWAGLSALEICLFATLSLLAIGAHLSDRAVLRQAQGTARRYRLRTAALFGLAALSRPEGYLLFALSLADFTWNSWSHRPERAAAGVHAPRTTHHAPRMILRQLPLLPVALFAAIVLPYLLFSLRTSGHLLPNTYHAKAVANFLPDRDFLSVAARYLILDNPLLLPFYVLGVFVLFCPALSGSTARLSSPRRHAVLLSLWSVGLPLVYAFLHAVLYQHGRYLIPLIPCNAIIGIVGLLEARWLLLRRRWQAPWQAPHAVGGSVTATPGRKFAMLVSLLVVAGTAWRLPTMARLYAWNVDNINEMHVALGRWAVAHTPPDALLALNDIGAITYVSERPVVDLAGLVTPEVVPLLRLPDRDSYLVDFMAERDVQYVLIFPNWFPDLAARRDLLEPVHQVTLERNTICGGQTMVVYRAHWRR